MEDAEQEKVDNASNVVEVEGVERDAVKRDAGASPPPVRPGISAVLYLVFFLAGTLRKQLVELVANLQPVIAQENDMVVGKTISFGQPLVRASLLLSLGISESDFDAVGYSIDDTGAKDEDLVALNSLALSSVPSDYDSAFALARSINEGVLALGACKSDDLSGGLAGAGSAMQQYSCEALPATTKKAMEEWIDLEEKACRADAFDVDTLFHDCMLFSSHNPGSNYILMGEVSFSMKLSCEYRSISLKAWNELAVSSVSKLSSPFKYLNDHRLVCTGPFEIDLEGGFVRKTRKLVDQKWTAATHELPFVDRCDESSTYSELKKWKGGVQVGAFEIVQWCADCGWDSTREETCPRHVSAHRCWSEVLSLVDTTTALTWETVGRSLPQRILRAAMNGDLEDLSKFSEFWLEFEEILLAKGITDSVSKEVFRSTFGWGFKVMREVVDYSRWVSTEAALHNAGMLDPGTQHVIEMRCTASDGDVTEKLDAPANYRVQGQQVRIPWWSKLINIMVTLLMLVMTFASMYMPDSRNVHVLLGIVWIVALVGAWEFELAVSSSVLKACEMRVTATIGGAEGWLTVLWESIIGRLSVGALAVSLAQCLCWLQNPWVLCTGMIPAGPSKALIYCGAFYAVYVSIFCATWWNACSADHDIHVYDRFLPLVLGAPAAVLITESLTRSAESNAVCRWEEMKSEREDLRHDDWDAKIWKLPLFKQLFADTECDVNKTGSSEDAPLRVCFKKPRLEQISKKFHDPTTHKKSLIYGLEVVGKRLENGVIVLSEEGMFRGECLEEVEPEVEVGAKEKKSTRKSFVARSETLNQIKKYKSSVGLIKRLLASKGMGDGADLARMKTIEDHTRDLEDSSEAMGALKDGEMVELRKQLAVAEGERDAYAGALSKAIVEAGKYQIKTEGELKYRKNLCLIAATTAQPMSPTFLGYMMNDPSLMKLGPLPPSPGGGDED